MQLDCVIGDSGALNRGADVVYTSSFNLRDGGARIAVLIPGDRLDALSPGEVEVIVDQLRKRILGARS